MEKTTNILFIHLPSFIFLLSILSEKQKTVTNIHLSKCGTIKYFTFLLSWIIKQLLMTSDIKLMSAEYCCV